MNKFKRIYKRLCFSRRTGDVLNYLTLQISDPEIAKQYEIARCVHFARLFKPTLVLAIFYFLFKLFQYYVMGDQPLIRMLTSLCILLWAILWGIFSWKLPRHAPKLMILQLVYHCALTNLSIRDNLPEQLRETDKVGDDQKLFILTVLVHCVNYNTFLTSIFVVPPVILVSAYCQYISQVDQWVHPYTHKPFESQADKNSFILTQMFLIFALVFATTAHHYLIQRDLITLVIEKQMLLRAQTQLTQFLEQSQDSIIIASNNDSRNKKSQIQFCNSAVTKMFGFNIAPKKEESLLIESEVDVRTPILKMNSKDLDSNGKPDLSNDDDPQSFQSLISKDLKSIWDIIIDPKILGSQKCLTAKVCLPKQQNNDENTNSASIRYIQVSIESILFNGEECCLLRCQDLSQIQENAKLVANNKMLTLMSSSISHELITPLKCILQVAQVLQTRITDSEGKFDIQLILNAAGLLLNQVKGSLDRNLLDNNIFTPNPETQNLQQMLSSTIDLLRPQAKAHNVTIELKGLFNEKITVMIDKLRVQQVLINLIQNSIKFSPAKGIISITLDQFVVNEPQTTIGVNIRVTDQGMGISQEDRVNLFKPFFQSKNEESRNINTNSHGIGLNLCKRIANSMGGDLQLNEEVTKGCQFCFSLTLKKVQSENSKQKIKSKRLKFGKKQVNLNRQGSYEDDLMIIAEATEQEENFTVTVQDTPQFLNEDEINEQEIRLNLSLPSKFIEDEFKGRIIVAEDQMINIQVLKNQMTELKQVDRCDFCYNGEEAIQIAKDLIEKSIKEAPKDQKVQLRPISLMLLDFQMPRKNGIQVIESVRRLINGFNVINQLTVHLEEPLFVFLTAYSSRAFIQHITSLKVEHCYEKPLQIAQLQQILQFEENLFLHIENNSTETQNIN